MLELFPSDASILLNRNEGEFVYAWSLSAQFELATFSAKDLDDFIIENSHEYRFGFVAYDAKNDIFPHLNSQNQDLLLLPEVNFMVFDHVLFFKNEQLVYFGKKNGFELVLEQLKTQQSQTIKPVTYLRKTHFKSLTNKSTYLDYVNKIKDSLQRGDIYEVNFCIQNLIEFENEVSDFDVYTYFLEQTKAPFSTLISLPNYSIISASPERFICKQKMLLKSQPIKGTAKRDKRDQENDNKLKKALESNPKERSENIMIVDLVRNDLSKLAHKNSVQVSELCQLYTFDNIHQLISTVNAKVDSNTTFTDILKNLFPMGSMTGAPKLNAMKFIESCESFKRGVYSGTIGFISPENDMDFNVVIRSLIRNHEKNIHAISVGGAITIQSDPEKEWEECKTKLHSILPK